MEKERYYSLNAYLKERFNSKIYKLALDEGMTCPNRDGTLGNKGCIFCSAGGSGDFAQKRDTSVSEQIKKAKERVKDKIKDGKYIAYFQSYTNTYAPVSYLRELFFEAISEKDIVALSIGTRPDCLGEEVLDLLEELNNVKPVFVELGLQTVHERTAKFIRRGYPLSVYDAAAANLKKRGINVVTHVIIGLPDESKEDILATVRYVADKTDGIKLQLLHILKGTDLEEHYLRGEFKALTMEEYFSILKDCIRILPKNVVIHRLTGDAPKSLLVAPEWSADKKRVLNSMKKYFDAEDVFQGELFN